MIGKKKDIEIPKMDLDADGLPSDAELDALQNAIDRELEGVNQRDPEAGDAESEAEATPEQRIEALELELANLKDQALRAMADAENVKKRAEREVTAAKTYGIERFAVDMLAVHDNLSRELTEKDLIMILARHGVRAVPGTGSKFDPNVHQAVANIPSDEDKGNVATVMQTGFTLGDRTLRAAMVAVSTGPAKA